MESMVDDMMDIDSFEVPLPLLSPRDTYELQKPTVQTSASRKEKRKKQNRESATRARVASKLLLANLKKNVARLMKVHAALRREHQELSQENQRLKRCSPQQQKDCELDEHAKVPSNKVLFSWSEVAN